MSSADYANIGDQAEWEADYFELELAPIESNQLSDDDEYLEGQRDRLFDEEEEEIIEVQSV